MAQGTTKGVPIDTDVALTANSDILVPSQKAVKTYADTKVSSVIGTSPIISSGGTTPSISIPLADGHTDGYLSASDFTTFSGKGIGDMVLSSIQTNSGTKTFLDTTFLLRNVANTFNGSFTNTNTADRIYTLPNSSGTIALTSDLSNYVTYSGLSSQLYRKVNVTDSGVISSSTALTLVYSQLIPANTFAAGDIITISWRGQKTNFNAGNTQYFYINTSNTVSGATLLGTHGTSTNVRMVQMDRKLYIKNTTTNTEVYSPTSPVALYYTATSTATFSNIAINWTIDQYLIAANTLTSALDTFKGSSFEIERTRTT